MQSNSQDLLAGIVLVFVVVIYVVLIALIVASWWKIFVKAGRPGWAAIVPVYNIVVMLQVVDMPWWLVFLLFVPIVSLCWVVISIMIPFKLATAFGRGLGFGFGLLLLPIVFYPILAFGSAEYGAGSDWP